MFRPLLVCLALGGVASAVTFFGPGVGTLGQVIATGEAGDTGSARFSQEFAVPLPNWKPNAFQRWWVSRSNGVLTLVNPRISWSCPRGKGRGAVISSPSSVRLEAVTLGAGAFRTPIADTNLTWDSYVLQSPDLSIPVSGAQVLRILDEAGPVVLKAHLRLPGPVDAWIGCTPKLHAKTLLKQ
ncbi:hypothetical protein V3W47_06295 [Deinococcus sp. YIM 134068]|uniref:hypothetical protein n=1 Tax=Deinococcus lichenicola TaxID=3118910 RepID=UPI002F95737B